MANLQQTPVQAGETTTVTFTTYDQSGNPVYNKIIVPPGKSPTLPSNLVTQPDLVNLISGNLWLGSSDLPCFGLHWDVPNNQFLGMLGSEESVVWTRIAASDTSGIYHSARGNVFVETSDNASSLIQDFQIQNASDGQVISFPQGFSNANPVSVLVTPICGTSGTIPTVGVTNVNQYNFTLRTSAQTSICVHVKGNVS